MTSRLPRLAALAGLAFGAACAPVTSGPATTPAPVPRRDPNVVPPIEREARALWVTTVANIDWPSKPGLPAEQQRAELLSMFDRAQTAGMNAIFFHVRPNADAVYRSSLEPWASMLTGTQGTDPGYDPLELAVAEAHRRGMELHAWINPFRAGSVADSARRAPNHVV